MLLDRRHLPRLVAVLLLGLVGLTGVGVAATPASAAVGPGWVRAAHLVPGVAPAQVTLTPSTGGAPVVLTGDAGLSYGSATPFRSLPTGSYAVSVRLSGQASGQPLLTSTWTSTPGGAVTLALLGSSSSPRLAVLQDDLTPPAPGTGRVRLLPAADAAPTVTVQAVGGPTLASDAVFGQPTGYVTVPSGTWPLRLSGPGGVSGAGTVTIASGAVYTVIIADQPGASHTLDVVPVQDAAGAAVAPAGGAQTGLGGTATEVVGASPHAADGAGAGALGGLALLLAAVVRRRRGARSTPA